MNKFQEMRKDSLGGSDIAAVLRFDEYRGPLAVYMEKKGLYSQPENEFMRMGKELEPIIIAKYRQQAGTPVRRPTTSISTWAVAAISSTSTSTASQRSSGANMLSSTW